MNRALNGNENSNKPVVNISWNDAIIFCNLLSKKAGLKEYYSISEDGLIVSCNLDSNGYRLPLKQSGNMRVRQELRDTYMEN